MVNDHKPAFLWLVATRIEKFLTRMPRKSPEKIRRARHPIPNMERTLNATEVLLMPTGQIHRLLDHVRRVALSPTEPVTDGELVDSFLARRDEAAFEALVRRHGPMVLGVCRRLIGNSHDAEDAFQVTFLILVRKAATIRPRQAVGNWLYGVAYRTALEARGRVLRRRAREKQVTVMPHPSFEPDPVWHDLRTILDGELNRLSDKYRLPVVLCDLEGRSRKEVARQLAIPEGTLSSRLASARKTLARRLARHGLSLSATTLAALLTQHEASAAVPAALVTATTRAGMLLAAGQATAAAGLVSVPVATLMEGVMKAMLLTKIKTVTVVLCGATLVGLGGSGLWHQARAGGAGPDGPRQQQVGREPGRKPIHIGADGGLLVAHRETPADPTVRLEEVQEELAKARREVQELKEQLEKERQRAEAGRRRYQEMVLEMKKRVEEAQAQAQRTLYANQMQRAAEEWAAQKGDNATEDRPWPESALKDLHVKRAKYLEDLELQRRGLQEQLKRLEVQQRQALADLDQQQEEIKQRLNATAPRLGNDRPASGDKLDRILERLGKIERRLDRLEGGRGQGRAP
jgi:RNA polymerase sigma factor (sigma-70 family)